MMRLVVATFNAHKCEEFERLFAGASIDLVSLAEYPDITPAVEDGETFTENALLKAHPVARETGCWALADDSGLVVDALGGRPGIHSARFAGANADDEANNRLLLEQLGERPATERTARFVCALALVSPSEEEHVVEGCVEGWIAFAPAGATGFGYDPLFVIPEYERTFAELGGAIKDQLSHRGRAVTAMREILSTLVTTGEPA